MPIYEYHCDNCEEDFEKFLRSMFSAEEITCPTCDSAHVSKKISLFGHSSSSAGMTGSAASCGPVG